MSKPSEEALKLVRDILLCDLYGIEGEFIEELALRVDALVQEAVDNKCIAIAQILNAQAQHFERMIRSEKEAFEEGDYDEELHLALIQKWRIRGSELRKAANLIRVQKAERKDE